MRKLPVILTAATAIALFASPASAELGSDNPTDAMLVTQREVEAGCDASTVPPTCPSGTAKRLQFRNLRHCFSAGSNDVHTGEARSPRQVRRRRRVYAE